MGRPRMWIWIIGLVVVAGGAYLAMSQYFDNVEQPEYRVVATQDDKEIRAYGPMIVAEVTVNGSRDASAGKAFSILAAYIFAKERDGEAVPMTAPVTQSPREKISMTAPVTQSPRTEDGEWTVRFVMPKKYTMATLPKPQNNAIALKQVPAGERAAIKFSGNATDALMSSKEKELRTWISSRNVSINGPATYAYYNAPFTPGFMRRNEVMFDIAK